MENNKHLIVYKILGNQSCTKPCIVVASTPPFSGAILPVYFLDPVPDLRLLEEKSSSVEGPLLVCFSSFVVHEWCSNRKVLLVRAGNIAEIMQLAPHPV